MMTTEFPCPYCGATARISKAFHTHVEFVCPGGTRITYKYDGISNGTEVQCHPPEVHECYTLDCTWNNHEWPYNVDAPIPAEAALYQ